MAWYHDISRQNSKIREIIPFAHRAKKMCVNTKGRRCLGRWLLIRKEGCFTYSLSISQKEKLITRKVAKSMLFWILDCPKGLFSFDHPFWLLTVCEAPERIAGLLLVIHSWPKIWCACALVACSLALLRLIWLTHEALCIAHLLTKTKEVWQSKLIETQYSASHFSTTVPCQRRTVQI